MPHYILSGRKGLFPSVTVLRRADSANDALAAFQEEGFTDIVLHTDDAMATTIDLRVFQNGTTPKQFLQFTTTPNTYSARFRRYLLNAAPWWPVQIVGVILLIFMVKSAIQLGDPFAQLRLLWVVIPLILASIATLLSRPAQLYGELIDALAWHRPDVALKRLESLRRSGAAIMLPPHELPFHEAKILAMQDHLEEALNLAETVRDVTPDWLFWNGISEIYTFGRQNAERLAAMECCVKAAPENPTCLLDLAMTLVRVNGDMARAREMLHRAQAQTLAEPIQPFVKLAEGMIAVQTGDAATAVPLLEEALKRNELLERSNGYAGVINDRTRAYLALAYNLLGNHVSAVAYFRQAERRLQLVPTLWDLRDRCLKELRVTSGDEFV